MTAEMLKMFKKSDNPHDALADLLLGTCGLEINGASLDSIYLTPVQQKIYQDVVDQGYEVGLRRSWL